MTYKIRQPFILLLFAVLTFSIYANTLDAPFVFDDSPNIRNNTKIRVTELNLPNLLKAGRESPNHNRPVANISFALNYYFDRYRPVGYHLVNILIHVCAGILLYFFLKVTLTHSRKTTDKHFDISTVAFFAALIWLVHPLQTQAVTYIVQRMASMSVMFYMLSMWLYAKGRLLQRQQPPPSFAVIAYFSGCLVAGFLALGCKEIAATLPFFILLYEWYFIQDLSFKWLRDRLPLVIGIIVVFALLGVFYLGVNFLDPILGSYEKRDFTLGQRVLTELRVVIFYFSQLVFPHPTRLNLDHDFVISHSLINPVSTAFSLMALAAVLGLAVFSAKKERFLSFCILWGLGQLAIESSVIGLEIAFEHRMYMPSMFATAGVVLLVCRFIRSQAVVLLLVGAVVACCSVWTYERNGVWQDEITLYTDSSLKSPNKSRPHHNLGFVYSSLGNIEKSIDHYRLALQLDPNADSHNNLGVELFHAGRVSEAVEHYRKALQLKPRFHPAHSNLGMVSARSGKLDEAIESYRVALQLNPSYAPAHNNIANAYMKLNRLAEAAHHYRRAIELKPEAADAYNNLGAVLLKIGRVDEAIVLFRKAMELDPRYKAARDNYINTSRTRRIESRDTQG